MFSVNHNGAAVFTILIASGIQAHVRHATLSPPGISKHRSSTEKQGKIWDCNQKADTEQCEIILILFG